MSRTNQHRINHLRGISLDYMQTELGPWVSCRRKSCTGTMVEVWTRYTSHGPINIERECISCGKVLKDPRYKAQRERRYREKRKQWQARQDNANMKHKRRSS